MLPTQRTHFIDSATGPEAIRQVIQTMQPGERLRFDSKAALKHLIYAAGQLQPGSVFSYDSSLEFSTVLSIAQNLHEAALLHINHKTTRVDEIAYGIKNNAGLMLDPAMDLATMQLAAKHLKPGRRFFFDGKMPLQSSLAILPELQPGIVIQFGSDTPYLLAESVAKQLPKHLCLGFTADQVEMMIELSKLNKQIVFTSEPNISATALSRFVNHMHAGDVFCPDKATPVPVLESIALSMNPYATLMIPRGMSDQALIAIAAKIKHGHKLSANPQLTQEQLILIARSMAVGAYFTPSARTAAKLMQALAKNMREGSRLQLKPQMTMEAAIEVAKHINPKAELTLEAGIPETVLASILSNLTAKANISIRLPHHCYKTDLNSAIQMAKLINVACHLTLAPDSPAAIMELVAANLRPQTARLKLHSGTAIDSVKRLAAAVAPGVLLELDPRCSEAKLVALAEHLNPSAILKLDSSCKQENIWLIAEHLNPGAILFLDSCLEEATLTAAAAKLRAGALLCIDAWAEDSLRAKLASVLKPGSSLLHTIHTAPEIIANSASANPRKRAIEQGEEEAESPKQIIKRFWTFSKNDSPKLDSPNHQAMNI